MNAEELLTKYAGGERKFKNINLSGLDLNSADLSEIDLQGADLAGCNLDQVNLSKEPIFCKFK